MNQALSTFSVTHQLYSDLDRLNDEFSRSRTTTHTHKHTHTYTRTCTHTHIHTHPAEPLWTSDQLVEMAATYTTHNKHNRRKYMSLEGFEPAPPAIEWSLDSPATGIDLFYCIDRCHGMLVVTIIITSSQHYWILHKRILCW
jgi:hypothetical protein